MRSQGRVAHRGIAPLRPHRTVRETLVSSGSSRPEQTLLPVVRSRQFLPDHRLTVALPLDDPSLQLHYRAFLTTTSDSAPVLRLGTLAGAACLTGSRHIGVLTFLMEARVTVTPPPCRTPVSSGTPQPCPRRGTRSWCRQETFRHVIRGSLPLVSVIHT